MEANRPKRTICLPLLFVVLMIFCGVAIAEDNCTESGCHDGYLKKSNVHAPVRGRNCLKCHIGSDHPYSLPKKKSDTCIACHKWTMKKNIHSPVKDGDCSSCHNPHASANAKLLNKPGAELCFDCHDKKIVSEKIVHPPLQDGCAFCHDPHDSDNKKLLKDTGKNLCYTCHGKKDKQAVVHMPIKDGECTGCHTPHSSKNKFLLVAEGNNLCFTCHDQKTYIGKKSSHAPVKEDCKNCHLHHDGAVKSLLKTATLCIDCHGEMKNEKIVHPPVESKECGGCHTPHTSDAGRLLKEKIPGLCFQCHGKEAFTKKHIHPPVKDECNSCHKGHSSNFAKLLLTKRESLCDLCHSDLSSNAKKYKYVHPPVKDSQCEQCHVPHSSEFPKVLRLFQGTLCSECHNLGDAKQAKSIHTPVEEGQCVSCHGPHGGNAAKFLVGRFPDENYISFAPDRFELCFKCHSADIARDAKTLTATDFRNGDRNLHYIHINKDKGRNCRFCHDPHMSAQSKLIKPQFQGFGTWNIPIFFTKTLTGGGCNVGCHKPLYYDRVKPVKNK